MPGAECRVRMLGAPSKTRTLRLGWETTKERKAQTMGYPIHSTSSVEWVGNERKKGTNHWVPLDKEEVFVNHKKSRTIPGGA